MHASEALQNQGRGGDTAAEKRLGQSWPLISNNTIKSTGGLVSSARVWSKSLNNVKYTAILLMILMDSVFR